VTDAKTVYNAIKTGYRLFDGAGDYGNEKEAGEGVQRALKDGLVKRDELCKLLVNKKLCGIRADAFVRPSHYLQGKYMSIDA
jgi:diketogulonate reductase-like aldo/keto reductase